MDISFSLAKLAKQKGFKPTTVKFYSDKKNGSRNAEEPKSFNELEPSEMYGETYSCTDIEVLKKWFNINGDSEEEVMEALVLVGVEPAISPVIEPEVTVEEVIEPEVEEVIEPEVTEEEPSR